MNFRRFETVLDSSRLYCGNNRFPKNSISVRTSLAKDPWCQNFIFSGLNRRDLAAYLRARMSKSGLCPQSNSLKQATF